MFDKDRRRIIRRTRNPKETAEKLATIAIFLGISEEVLAAALLEGALDALDDAMGGNEKPWADIDCDCCRADREEAAARQHHGHA